MSRTSHPRSRPPFALAGLLIAITFVCYWPSLTGGFLWDDDVLILKDPLVKTASGLYRIWFTTQSIDYWPVTYTSFWAEWHLFGASATGYHVVGVLLHLTSALLLWALLRRMSLPGAYLAALLFAVHPVNVESVAWISEQKNTLSLVFLLLAAWWYLDESADGNRRRYWFSFAAFVLAMLAKGSVATFPLILLILIWWRGPRVSWNSVTRLVPFFVVAAAMTLVNVWFQTHGANEVIRRATTIERVLGAAAAIWFYLWKVLWPANLLFVYPNWTVDAADWRWWIPLAGVACTTLALIWWRRIDWVRSTLAAWLIFSAALLPALGLTDVYFMKYSLVADRYQYVAMIAIVTLVAAGAERVAVWLTRGFTWRAARAGNSQ